MHSYIIEEPFELGNRPPNNSLPGTRMRERCLVMDRQDCERLHALFVATYADASEGELEDYTFGICQYIHDMAAPLFGRQYANKICVAGFLWLAQKWPHFSGQLTYPVGAASSYYSSPYKFRGGQLQARLRCLEFCADYLERLLDGEPAT